MYVYVYVWKYMQEPVNENHELDEVDGAVAIYVELVQHALRFLLNTNDNRYNALHTTYTFINTYTFCLPPIYLDIYIQYKYKICNTDPPQYIHTHIFS